MKFRSLIFSLKENKVLVFIVLISSIILGAVTFPNHYNFRTYNLDLGVYTNAMYDYIHFQWNDSMSFKREPENLLADHFDLYLIIFSPLSLIFKSYTLLVVQWLFVLIGGIGVFKVILLKSSKKYLANLAAIHFFLFFGIIAALNFDYHSNVVATMIVPWFILAILKQNLRTAFILLICIIIGKENMSLWMFLLTIGLAIDQWKSKRIRNYLFLLSGISLLLFIAIIGFIMPAISNSGEYPHFHYNILGANGKQAILFMLQHPIDSLIIMFTNHIGDPDANYIKAETYMFLCLSGLPLLLRKPQYLIMLIPIFFQKMFHDNFFMWSHSAQYSIEFAPILSIGAFVVLSDIKLKSVSYSLGVLLIALTSYGTFKTTDDTIYWTDKTRLKIYSKDHYKRNFDVKFAHSQLNKIPEGAIVSTQPSFIPHVAWRDRIYEFPRIDNADYIIFHKDEYTTPLGPEDFEKITTELLNSTTWTTIVNKKGVVILKRKK